MFEKYDETELQTLLTQNTPQTFIATLSNYENHHNSGNPSLTPAPISGWKQFAIGLFTGLLKIPLVVGIALLGTTILSSLLLIPIILLGIAGIVILQEIEKKERLVNLERDILSLKEIIHLELLRKRLIKEIIQWQFIDNKEPAKKNLLYKLESYKVDIEEKLTEKSHPPEVPIPQLKSVSLKSLLYQGAVALTFPMVGIALWTGLSILITLGYTALVATLFTPLFIGATVALLLTALWFVYYNRSRLSNKNICSDRETTTLSQASDCGFANAENLMNSTLDNSKKARKEINARDQAEINQALEICTKIIEGVDDKKQNTAEEESDQGISEPFSPILSNSFF